MSVPKPSRRSLLVGLPAAAGLTALGLGTKADTLPKVAVSKDPACGCCSAWVDHVRAAGFPASVSETADLAALKRRLGVPAELVSCHTAEVAGYVLEGHVPADAVRRLLAERPRATGLAVPGMPIGSPGMEVPGTPPDTFEVVLFGPAGRSVFSRYRGSVPI